MKSITNVSNERGMINTSNFETISKRRSDKSTKNGTGDLTPVPPKIGKGCVKVGLPMKGVIRGSVGS